MDLWSWFMHRLKEIPKGPRGGPLVWNAILPLVLGITDGSCAVSHHVWSAPLHHSQLLLLCCLTENDTASIISLDAQAYCYKSPLIIYFFIHSCGLVLFLLLDLLGSDWVVIAICIIIFCLFLHASLLLLWALLISWAYGLSTGHKDSVKNSW